MSLFGRGALSLKGKSRCRVLRKSLMKVLYIIAVFGLMRFYGKLYTGVIWENIWLSNCENTFERADRLRLTGILSSALWFLLRCNYYIDMSQPHQCITQSQFLNRVTLYRFFLLTLLLFCPNFCNFKTVFLNVRTSRTLLYIPTPVDSAL